MLVGIHRSIVGLVFHKICLVCVTDLHWTHSHSRQSSSVYYREPTNLISAHIYSHQMFKCFICLFKQIKNGRKKKLLGLKNPTLKQKYWKRSNMDSYLSHTSLYWHTCHSSSLLLKLLSCWNENWKSTNRREPHPNLLDMFHSFLSQSAPAITEGKITDYCLAQCLQNILGNVVL